MKTSKKFIAAILSLVMLLALAGCKKDDALDPDRNANTSNTISAGGYPTPGDPNYGLEDGEQPGKAKNEEENINKSPFDNILDEYLDNEEVHPKVSAYMGGRLMDTIATGNSVHGVYWTDKGTRHMYLDRYEMGESQGPKEINVTDELWDAIHSKANDDLSIIEGQDGPFVFFEATYLQDIFVDFPEFFNAE